MMATDQTVTAFEREGGSVSAKSRIQARVNTVYLIASAKSKAHTHKRTLTHTDTCT